MNIIIASFQGHSQILSHSHGEWQQGGGGGCCSYQRYNSMRLLILQYVFLVGGVWPWLLSCFRNAIKISCLQKVSQCCSCTSSLIVSTSKWQKLWWKREKKLGAWRKNGREDRERKCSHNAVKSASHENDECEREQQCLTKQIKRVVVLRNEHSVWFETALTSSKLSTRRMYALPSSHFSYFVAHAWPIVPKHVTCLLTNPHVLVGSKVIEMPVRHTLWIRTPSSLGH